LRVIQLDAPAVGYPETGLEEINIGDLLETGFGTTSAESA
jgi:hypothetical protein